MVSTSYCSSLSMRLGDGQEKFSLCSIVSTYGGSRDAWNTGCIVYWNGSSSLYVTGDRTFNILKGL